MSDTRATAGSNREPVDLPPSAGSNPRGPLNHGRENMVIPGPSVIPERVLAAMAHPMSDIYSGELVDVSDEIFAKLPGIARTEGRVFAIIANGHGAWLMAIANTLSRGDKVLVLQSGIFALVWGQLAAVSGIEVEVLPASGRGPVDVEALAARLSADPGHEIKAVLAVQTDTASSVRNDVAAMRAAIDAADHPALFMVDCIASLGCEPYEMDAWGVDVTVGASQKGLMVPPGLGFVWANERALAAYETAGLKDGYTDWGPRLNPTQHYQLYAGTPPVSHLYALREALRMIEDEGGTEAVWARHEMLASAVWAAVEAWSSPDGIEFNIVSPSYRSAAVTTILSNSIDAERLRDICRDNAGLVLGTGIGDFAGRSFRIGHMGYVDPPMILGAIATTEAGLRSMGAPLGASGIAAATARVGELLNK